jgi:hypothetical protein
MAAENVKHTSHPAQERSAANQRDQILRFCNTGHVWMDVLVLVCSKLTPKLTLWSQTHVLVWC